MKELEKRIEKWRRQHRGETDDVRSQELEEGSVERKPFGVIDLFPLKECQKEKT